MKIRITMKDPDGFWNCVDEAVKQSLKTIEGISDEEREYLEEKRSEEIKDKLKKWFEYDEYLTVEVDTDANTCIVIPNK